MDAGLRRDLEEKVRGGERLTREDGLALYGTDDLAWLGGLAHEARTRRHGDTGYFTVSRGLELTGGAADGTVGGVEDAVRRAQDLASGGIGELRVVAGPELPWEEYSRALRALRQALPRVALRACTAAGVHRFEKTPGLTAEAILDELVDAGLESFTADGTEPANAGGEAPAEGASADGASAEGRTAADGLAWEDWSRIHRFAHAKGLTTPCTLLYGRGRAAGDGAEPLHGSRHSVEHVIRLRELQDETGGFRVFAPLSGTATGAELLKTFAVSRLLFDNVPHVAACWSTYGERAALLALQHGADEVDASFAGAGAEASGAAEGSGAVVPPTREDLLDLIRDAGLRPVERDARYGVVREYEGADPGRRDAPQPMRL